MLISRFQLAARKNLWKTKPGFPLIRRQNDAMEKASWQNSSGQGYNDSSFTMIFASIFGSFVAIALLQRLWPRKVEVIHKSREESLSPPDSYRSV
jgi:hypothetical protein